MRGLRAVLVAGLLLASCSSAGPEEAAPSPSVTEAVPSQPASPSPLTDDRVVPSLAEVPSGDLGLWLDTIGVPVVAAVRTSTELAQLADATPEQRASTCRRVATDLDTIGAPELLTALAITADGETATLLVGDLSAKADLLAVCLGGGSELDEAIREVEHTHAVAVAWLDQLRSGA